jgi:23S rRNA pseudouridine2457 synthase
MYQYLKLYKPYGVLSQFTQEVDGQRTLKEFMPDIDADIYPIGRLDKDSEGLLLLTNHRKITQELLHPSRHHLRTYWVQVEGKIDTIYLDQLTSGVSFRAKKKNYFSSMQEATLIHPNIEDRVPPIRYRAHIPTSWVKVSLTEGKNRQVRKMFAAIGFPVLRLIRYAIEDITLQDMPIGIYETISEKDFYKALKL